MNTVVENAGRAIGWRLDPRRALIVIHDVLVMTISFPLAILLRDWPTIRAATWEATALGTSVLLVIAAGTYSALAFHRGMWRYSSLTDLLAAARLVTLVMLLFVPAMFLLDRLSNIPRSAIVIAWLLGVVGICGSRAIYSRWVRSSRRTPALSGAPAGKRIAPILLVGSGDAAELVIQMCERMAHTGPRAEVVGILDDRGTVGRTLGGVPVLGGLGDLRRVLTRLGVTGRSPSRVIVTRPRHELDEQALERLVSDAHRTGLEVMQLPDLLRFRGETASAGTRLENYPVPTYHRLKRPVEAILSAACLLVSAPIMLATAIGVRLFLGAPVQFDQLRVGRGGHEFAVKKFRTMHDAAATDGDLLPDDHRNSAFGDFLRRTRIDELPQLWSVLLGEMALVGPRPLLACEQDSMPDGLRHRRLAVRPGLTGWAQVNGGQLLDARQKLALDLFYIKHASPEMDLRILLLTLRMLLIGDRVNDHALERAEFELSTGSAEIQVNL